MKIFSILLLLAQTFTASVLIIRLTNVENLPTNGIKNEDVGIHVKNFENIGKNIVDKDFIVPPLNMGLGTLKYISEFMNIEDSSFIVGLCNRLITPANIVFDDKWWNDATFFQREQLVFHELGHCVLNRGHKDSKVITTLGEIPSSIMYDHVIEPEIYVRHRNEYILELFTEIDIAKIIETKQ